MVTVALADLVASATLVAVTIAVVFDVTVEAVYSPELLIVPFVAVHVTAVLVVPVTVAVNCCVPPDATVALVGEMETAVGLKPVPASATVLEIPAAVTVSVPVALPDATGANITQTLQWVLDRKSVV